MSEEIAVNRKARHDYQIFDTYEAGIVLLGTENLQVALLWGYLKRSGVYQRQPGWGRHWWRMGRGCAALVIVVGVGLWLWPWQQWTHEPIITRIWKLAVLVCFGGAAYVGALFASGFRMKDLRGV